MKDHNFNMDSVVSLDEIVKLPEGQEMAIEDLVSADFYHAAVRQTYPDKLPEKPETGKRKRAGVYEEIYKKDFHIGFSKKRVGETIKAMIIGGSMDDETAKVLREVTEGVVEALKNGQSPEAKEKEISSPKKTASKRAQASQEES